MNRGVSNKVWRLSLVSLGLYTQVGGVCDFLIILGPHKFGVRGQVTAFKVQGDNTIIINIHHDLLGA